MHHYEMSLGHRIKPPFGGEIADCFAKSTGKQSERLVAGSGAVQHWELDLDTVLGDMRPHQISLEGPHMSGNEKVQQYDVEGTICLSTTSDSVRGLK